VSLFVIAALLLCAIALAYVFAPLIRERATAGAALVALGIGATAGLYALVGTPDALDPARRATPTTLADATVRLEQELRRDPMQVEGWRLLAEAYRAQGRMADASNAYTRALTFLPKDPDLLAQAAEARALAAPDRRFDAQAISLLDRALAMDPTHQRAAWFKGVAQRQAGRAADAARTWEALLARVDSGTGNSLRTQIDAARADAGLPPLPASGTTPARSPAARVTVRVALSTALAGSLPPATPVFVLARVPGGPPMPVAVRRITLAELPADVELGDVDSLMPTRRLSDVPRVEIVARASASGMANAAKGDLESRPVSVDLGGRVQVTIDQLRP
jgi:cytochrome c-type biogenesis protein CcmH